MNTLAVKPGKILQSIYIVQREDGLIKIGIASDPQKRIKTIALQGGFNCINHHISEKCSNARALENSLHKTFSDKRVKSEWFNASFEDATKAAAELDFSNKSIQGINYDGMEKLINFALGINERGVKHEQFATSI